MRITRRTGAAVVAGMCLAVGVTAYAVARPDEPVAVSLSSGDDGRGDGLGSILPLPDESTTSTAGPTTSTSGVDTTTTAAVSTTAAPTTATTAAGGGRAAPEKCSAPQTSPASGDLVGISTGDALVEVSVGSGAHRRIGRPMSYLASWSRDGRFVATSNNGAVEVFDIARGCVRTVATARAGKIVDVHAMSPDGSELTYFVWTSGNLPEGAQELRAVRRDGTGDRLLTAGGQGGSAWALDGSGRVAYGDRKGLWVRAADGKTTLLHATTGGAEFPVWSPDSSKVAFSISTDTGVWVAPATGGGGTRIVKDSFQVFWNEWSPDGRHIAYVYEKEVWLVGADGSSPHAVTTGADASGHAMWTADGGAIVYQHSGFGHGARVASVRPDGTGRTDLGVGQLFSVFRR